MILWLKLSRELFWEFEVYHLLPATLLSLIQLHTSLTLFLPFPCVIYASTVINPLSRLLLDFLFSFALNSAFL
jgi:hypothetical protein